MKSSNFPFISASQAMKDVINTVKRVSQFDTTVLITGESGTGKELIARSIHDNSGRKNMPFVAVNCGAIPDALIESELFGHKKGAFTDATRDKPGLFAEANNGTLFLDEIAELPPQLQAKLLRVLQDQKIRPVGSEEEIKVNVRLIAATLRDLAEDVKRNLFRDDLFYRLSVVSIHIAPLRERREDIPPLIEHFVEKINKRLGLKIKKVADDVVHLLTSHSWRGNVRELENCIERAMVLAEKDTVTVDDLPAALQILTSIDVHRKKLTTDNLSIKQNTKQMEIELIHEALKRTNNNRTKAAKLFGISHRALLYKIKAYRIEKSDK